MGFVEKRHKLREHTNIFMFSSRLIIIGMNNKYVDKKLIVFFMIK